MTPQEQKEIQQHLNRIAEILYCNTPAEKLQDFETIENTVREAEIEGLCDEVQPQKICDFLYHFGV